MTTAVISFVRSKAFQTTIGSRPDLFPLFYPQTARVEMVVPSTPEVELVLARAAAAHALWATFLVWQNLETATSQMLHAGAPYYNMNNPPRSLSPKEFNKLIPPDFFAPLWLKQMFPVSDQDPNAPRLADAIWYVSFGTTLPNKTAKENKSRSARNAMVMSAPAGGFSFGNEVTLVTLAASRLVNNTVLDGAYHHVYVYLCGADAPGTVRLAPSSGPGKPTALQKIYAGARGYMWRIQPGQSVELELTGPGTHIGAAVFAQIGSTVAPVYDVVSRGFAPRSAAALTTFAGPCSTRFEFDPATFETRKDFVYEPHYLVSLGANPVAEKRPHPIASSPEAQRLLNRAIETLYKPVDREGVTESESFIYRGLTSMTPILVLAYLEPDRVPERVFAQNLDRLYRRRGITAKTFIAALAADAADPVLRKVLFIEGTAVVNTMVYVPDQIFGRDADVHENARLTNSGDCEDFAEATLRILRHMQQHPLDAIVRPDVRALFEYVQRTGAECMMVHMRVNYRGRTSHAVSAAVVPRASSEGEVVYPDRGHQFLCLDGTTPENFDFSAPGDSAFCSEMQHMAEHHGKGAVEFYREPSPARASGEQFYRGFVGAVVCPRDPDANPPRYCFFLKEHSEKHVATGDGVAVMDVAVRGEYKLLAPASPIEPDVAAELRRMATFVPPLPPGGDAEDDGAFPAEYGEWVDRVRVAVDESKLAGSGEGRGFSVYINLAGPEKKIETAIETVRAMSGSDRVGRVVVDAYATFRGTAIIEVLFHPKKQ